MTRDRDAARRAETACPARVPDSTGKPGGEANRPNTSQGATMNPHQIAEGLSRADRRAVIRSAKHIEKAILALASLPRIGSVGANLHSALCELDEYLKSQERP